MPSAIALGFTACLVAGFIMTLVVMDLFLQAIEATIEQFSRKGD